MKLSNIRIRNFKAVKDSGSIKLGPLTAFVGYNGTGKSSIIEACEFFQRYTLDGLEEALADWYQFQHILWQGSARKRDPNSKFVTQPLNISFSGKTNKRPFSATLEVGELAEPVGYHPVQSVVTKREFCKVDGKTHEYQLKDHGRPRLGRPIFDRDVALNVREWMFLNLNPREIGRPRRRPESKASEPLLKTGANLADILKSFLDQDPDGFEALVEALQYIVPYTANIRPDVTKDIVETRSLIQLTEHFHSGQDVPLPGWVLSGGTLRLLALLAALRHPNGPSVLFIEELENGLDPRAIGFVVEEIRSAVQSGDKQVILTTHSPYLLDKLALEHIVTVERPDGGPPIFRRPTEEEELKAWSKDFAPGSLYTMGKLRSKERRVR